MSIKRLLFVLPVVAVMLVGASCVQQPGDAQKPSNQPAVNTENKNADQPAANASAEEGVSAEADAEWLTYTDPQGRFKFSHPVYAVPEASKEGNSITLRSRDGNGQLNEVPDLTIKISDGSVKIASWEDFDVEYFKGLVGSFNFVGFVNHEDWKWYDDPNGKYMFAHPAYAKVFANKDGSSLEIRSYDSATKDYYEVPDMTIKFGGQSAEFAIWEDFEVGYFKALVGSFKPK